MDNLYIKNIFKKKIKENNKKFIIFKILDLILRNIKILSKILT